MPVVTIVVSVKKKKRLAQDPQPPDRISTARKHCKRLIKRPLHWTETRSRHRLWKHGHTIGPQMLKLVPIAEEDEGCSSPEAELPSPLTPSSPSGGCFALLMSRLRPSPTPTLSPSTRSLRVVAAGTLFLTHTLSLPTHPGPTQTVRAHEYARSRGGSAPAILAVLSQLQVDKCWLVASLGGAQEARAVARELEAEGVSTRYCKVWEGAGVPAAWVLHAGKCPPLQHSTGHLRRRDGGILVRVRTREEPCYALLFRDHIFHVRSERETHLCSSGDSNSQSVINHNPLPDIPHEEFVSLLGPLLVPEHYPSPESPLASPPLSSPPPSPIISAPFDWIHFEGRSVKTTLNNLQGVDGLARERRWRSQCVFSVDVGRRAKQGIEAVRTFLIFFCITPS
jgi:hypothetical protein